MRWDWTAFTVDGAADRRGAADRHHRQRLGDGQVPVGHRRGAGVVPGRGAAGAGHRGAHLRRQAHRPGADADPDRPELDRLEEGDRGPGRQLGPDLEGRRRRDLRQGRRRGRHRHPDRRVLLLLDGRAHRGRALRLGGRGAVPAGRRRLGVGRRLEQPGREAVLGGRVLLVDAGRRSSASPASAPSRCRRAVPTRAPAASRWSASRVARSRRRTSRAGTSARRSACSHPASPSPCGAPVGRPPGRWSATGTATAATSSAGGATGRSRCR